MEKRINSFILVLTLVSRNLISCTDVSSQIAFENGKSIEDLNEINRQEIDSRFFKSFEEFSKPNGMKRRSQIYDSSRQPTVINNIQITMNDNETQSDVDKCKNGICNVSVSSERDDEGNIITDVHLKFITKLINSKTDDIPIVDGVRGVEKIVNLHHSRPIELHNIPQIQTRYEGGEPWYQGGRTFELIPPIKPVVDDKIEPPLSKT
ncbi:uncharacterized protein LOC108628878 [Ceratina calcarata]|uniref:Uncharacterized protein LOC108628878 n=1 Tax=Ceratina calcarata TaxID=156304 RepID=A0AAJ7NB62_9HYME|nr:uncharacterized protein LOC108628878 [Ceratina calcarata]